MSRKRKTSQRKSPKGRKPVAQTRTRRITQDQHVDAQTGQIVAVTPVTNAVSSALRSTSADTPTTQELGEIKPWVNRFGESDGRSALWYLGTKRKLSGNVGVLIQYARKNGIPLEQDVVAGEKITNLVANTILADEARMARLAAKFECEEKRFGYLEQFIRDIGNGRCRAVLVTGQSGTGKTHTILKVLVAELGYTLMNADEAAALEVKDELCNLKKIAIYYKGSTNKVPLYEALYLTRYAGFILICDDVDSVFATEDCLNLMKAATDSSRVRFVSAGTSKDMTNKATGLIIPPHMKYNGAVIWISNRDPKHKIDDAIKTRTDGYRADVTLTPEQMLRRMERHVVNSEEMNEQYSLETQQTAMQFLKDSMEDFGSVVSLRTLKPICNMVEAAANDDDGDAWKDRAMYSLYQMLLQKKEAA